MVLLTAVILLILSFTLNRAGRDTAQASAQKADRILKMRLEDCELASKNASYLPVISESYKKYLADGDKKELNTTVTTFLNQQYRYHTNLKDAVLVFTADPEVLYYTYNNSNNGTYKDVRIFSENTLKEVLDRSKDLDTDTRLVGDGGRIYMIRNLMDPKFKPYAMLILELDADSLAESMKSVWGYADSALYIRDSSQNGYAPLLTGGNRISSVMESGKIDPDSVADGQTGFRTVGGHSFVTGCINKYGRIVTVVELDNGVIRAGRSSYFVFALILLILLVPLLVIIRQYEQIYREEISLRDARIKAMQSQINPHFLNNTLEIINWEARLSENYKISGMIEALSTMLSATMNRKSEAVHTLREELSYVDAYLYIIARRYGEQLQVIRRIDESLLEMQVPRLIIQPIVENAVEHGVGVTGKGIVALTIDREETYMLIRIINNGSLSEEDAERIQKILAGQGDAGLHHVSLGIHNVNSRLKLIYGDDCGLTIENLSDRKILEAFPDRSDLLLQQTTFTISTIKITISDKKEQR